jgi:hypothetical protein
MNQTSSSANYALIGILIAFGIGVLSCMVSLTMMCKLKRYCCFRRAYGEDPEQDRLEREQRQREITDRTVRLIDLKLNHLSF